MGANERKPWPPPAKHEHVLGEVRRAGNGSNSAASNVLFVYRNAVLREDWSPAVPRIIQGRSFGEFTHIYCSICDANIDIRWEFNQEMLDALIERIQKPVV